MRFPLRNRVPDRDLTVGLSSKTNGRWVSTAFPGKIPPPTLRYDVWHDSELPRKHSRCVGFRIKTKNVVGGFFNFQCFLIIIRRLIKYWYRFEVNKYWRIPRFSLTVKKTLTQFQGRWPRILAGKGVDWLQSIISCLSRVVIMNAST